MVTLNEDVRAGMCVLEVAGEIDMASADAFRDRLLTCLEGSDSLRVDLSGVTFMDSSGLSALMLMHRAAAEAGKEAALIQLSPITSRLLDVSGLRGVLNVEPQAS